MQDFFVYFCIVQAGPIIWPMLPVTFKEADFFFVFINVLSMLKLKERAAVHENLYSCNQRFTVAKYEKKCLSYFLWVECFSLI